MTSWDESNSLVSSHFPKPASTFLIQIRLLVAEDELGATQQGLDKSGVRMPNFAGLNKAMDRHEPAPETPEQREFFLDLLRELKLIKSCSVQVKSVNF